MDKIRKRVCVFFFLSENVVVLSYNSTDKPHLAIFFLRFIRYYWMMIIIIIMNKRECARALLAYHI